jgi:NAD-dependent SIR2 family protein deacetylase
LGHKVLTKLYHSGYLKRLINQNHDGLLQKSGFPQHAINEIHGAWFDPSNPGGISENNEATIKDTLRF